MAWGRPSRTGAIALALTIVLGGCARPWVTQEAPPETVAAAVPAPSRTVPRPPTQSPSIPEPAHAEPAPVDLWTQLANDFTWQAPEHELIDAEVEELLQRPRTFKLRSRRAELFLWHITDRLASRGLPAELALVPMIESGYRAGVRSPWGAAGLWQFTENTGRRFGLAQTPAYDARADVVASTEAALDYLARLQRKFDGNWLLALAAYNCGPATVRRAIEKNGSSDFWLIRDDLPPGTRRHVARLLAAARIVSTPSRYGIALHPIANTPFFEEVDLGGPFDLRNFERHADDWPRETFARLNPGFLRPYTGVEGSSRVLVPVGWGARVKEIVAAVPASERVPRHVHVVRNGETLSAIAAHYAVAVDDIRTRNDLRGTFIKAGQKLIVPADAAAETTAATAGARRPVASDVRHVVRRGDSLWTIARQYGSSAGALARLNGLRTDAVLQPGQSLRVRRTADAKVYAVARGDSLWTIARRFNVSIDQLRAWNSLSRHQDLRPGQALIVSEPPDGARRNI